MNTPKIIKVGMDRYYVLLYVASEKTYVCVKERDIMESKKFDYATTTEVYVITETKKINIEIVE